MRFSHARLQLQRTRVVGDRARVLPHVGERDAALQVGRREIWVQPDRLVVFGDGTRMIGLAGAKLAVFEVGQGFVAPRARSILGLFALRLLLGLLGLRPLFGFPFRELLGFSLLSLCLSLGPLSCGLRIGQSASVLLDLCSRGPVSGCRAQVEVSNRQGCAEQADGQHPPARVGHSSCAGAHLRHDLGGRLEALENATTRRERLCREQQGPQLGDRLRALRLAGPQASVDAREKTCAIPIFCNNARRRQPVVVNAQRRFLRRSPRHAR